MAPSWILCRVLKWLPSLWSHPSISSLQSMDIPRWSVLLRKSIILLRSRGSRGWRMERATTLHQVSAQTLPQVAWDVHQAVWKSWESLGREGGTAAIILRCLSMASFALAMIEYRRMLIWSRSLFERSFKGVSRSSWTAGATQSRISYCFASCILSVAGILSCSSQCRANLMPSWIYHIWHIWRMSINTSFERCWGGFHELNQGQGYAAQQVIYASPYKWCTQVMKLSKRCTVTPFTIIGLCSVPSLPSAGSSWRIWRRGSECWINPPTSKPKVVSSTWK